jgi:pilus assembly protein CpaC
MRRLARPGRLAALAAAWCLGTALSGQTASAQPTPDASGEGARPVPEARTADARAGGMTIPIASRAPTDAPDQGRRAALVLEAGLGRVVNLPGAIANVFVADPRIAEVRPASPNTLFVFGAAPGRTTLAAMDGSGRVVAQYQVTVRPAAFNAAEASSTISRAMPGSSIRVETLPTGLAVSGQVATPADAARVMDMARSFLADKQTATNRLTVTSSTQISLRVRIAEMSRSVSRELGINWQALQGLGKYAAIGLATSNPVTATLAAPSVLAGAYVNRNLGLSAIIDALAQDNLVHLLAEPNLTTMSGEPASFLVGGEFPIPVAEQNNTISLVFKQYGVNLSFVPTLMSDDRINIHVRPEVSQLTNQGAVQLSTGNNSISIPALTVRRADTTVEVGSGDSFAIAGLLQETVTHGTSAVPWLGEIPILGALFRSDSFQRNESELVIIVTPYIVRPVSDPAVLRQPDDAYAPPNDLERLLLLRQTGQVGSVRPTRISGAAGWIVQ